MFLFRRKSERLISKRSGDNMSFESRRVQMETLEEKIEQQKPDWKQWTPLYGLYQIGKDINAGKPIIYYSGTRLKDGIIGIYVELSTSAVLIGATIGLYELSEKLF